MMWAEYMESALIVPLEVIQPCQCVGTEQDKGAWKNGEFASTHHMPPCMSAYAQKYVPPSLGTQRPASLCHHLSRDPEAHVLQTTLPSIFVRRQLNCRSGDISPTSCFAPTSPLHVSEWMGPWVRMTHTTFLGNPQPSSRNLSTK